LADNVVSTILADDDGNFWMTGNRGIQRVRRAELAAVADGALPRVHAVLYDRTDGLLSVETNGGFQPAAWRGRDGRFWFPTVRGVAVVDPVDAPIGAAPPRAVVEEILLDGTPAVSTEEIVIGPGRRGLEVRYTGLNLTAPQHVAFRYLLHGFDSEWALVGTRRAAIYPRLPPGRYRFEVQAANRDGTWGAAAIVPIRALPFAWETTWFRLLVLMTTLAAVAWAVRRRFALLELRAEHQRAFARRFIEGQETERQRIAAELHDSVGQGLLVAKNRATIALMRTDLGPETRAHLDEIASVMMETLETTREISHNLRPHELDQFGLGTAVRAAVERASSPTTQIAADVDSVDGLLGSDAEIAVYRIVQEAVNNVLKHSGATHARVSLRRDALGVRLLVADNGDGFAMDGTRPGFGLAGIAQRAALHGGRCDVQSAPGSGTTVVVTIPVASDATIPVAIPDAAPATVPGS
jgi:signal transduction histidine kinase